MTSHSFSAHSHHATHHTLPHHWLATLHHSLSGHLLHLRTHLHHWHLTHHPLAHLSLLSAHHTHLSICWNAKTKQNQQSNHSFFHVFLLLFSFSYKLLRFFI